jgi:uncharacterized protein YjbI with pentapeptide repeats
MADQEQLAILRQESAAWNAWRAKLVSYIQFDLRKSDLRKAPLSGANLAQADLTSRQGGRVSSRHSRPRQGRLFYELRFTGTIFSMPWTELTDV